MIKLSRLFAAMTMGLLMGLAFTPARAATIPAGSALAVEAGSRATAETVQYRRVYRAPRYARPGYVRRGYYGRPGYRRGYYGRPGFYPGPVYRRCYTRPRTVWTPYGYVRRWVRVCR